MARFLLVWYIRNTIIIVLFYYHRCLFFRSIVLNVARASPVPVTCKIRKVDGNDLQSTLNLAKRIEAAGCAALCVHGRTKVGVINIMRE